MRRGKKHSVPDGLSVPGGLSKEEIVAAIKLYNNMIIQAGMKISRDLWDCAVTAVIFSSNDFPEVNGVSVYFQDSMEV